MLRVGYPEQRAITPIRAHEGRRVSLDIEPFADQAELLQFAMELESMPGVSGLELLDAEPATALFVVYTRSANEFATLLTRMPDYRISSTSLGNMVSARLEDADRMAAFMLLPAAGAGGWSGARWWGRLAGAVAAGAAAAGLLYFAFSGSSQPTTPQPQAARTVNAVAPAAATPAVATPAVATPAAATPGVLPAATVAPAASATPAASPTAAPTGTPAVPTATPSATPPPVVTARYAGGFSTALGTVVALNGCVWDVSLNGNLYVSLTPQGGGNFSGPATMAGTIDYQVSNTPAGATCNAASTAVDASGSASGGGTITATLSGARELAITFTGSRQGSALVGDLSLRRAIGTVSSAGNTTETRSASASGVALSPN